ncbi:MAG: hypothetical protein A3G08_04325 [Candidatus Magasanikbacteria bacterium RIFCSPLOWO2_12_FULL_47_9b]|nr:MAG: hypothetical protein A3I74_01610 [Candidatus Magasanikbacteria bacterium RIFCSPLOWO2_02_FULL_47_16]OGH82093.1 MAG: hypothetical protein A3G08_04325 [Candidatus Magasanikbacteria bacterium RIFCSPLOWO2_12_FULL_47_9b]
MDRTNEVIKFVHSFVLKTKILTKVRILGGGPRGDRTPKTEIASPVVDQPLSALSPPIKVYYIVDLLALEKPKTPLREFWNTEWNRFHTGACYKNNYITQK